MDTKELARKVFDLEHVSFGKQLGLLEDGEDTPSYELVKRAVAEIDELSQSEESFSQRLCTQIIAVLWERAPDEYREGLRQIFVVALSRMGIAPSSVMIDSLKKLTGQYTALESYFSELETAANEATCELDVCGTKYLLTEFQRNMIEKIRSNRITGISAPTSSGKSYALYLTIVEHLAQNLGQVIVIVPTLSLVSQVAHDLVATAEALEVSDVSVTTAYEKRSGVRSVFVLTQERALSALQEEMATEAVTYLVVDEVQNLERVGNEDDQRSKILLDVLKDMEEAGSLDKIVLSGPRLNNIGNLAFEIFGEVGVEEHSEVSPVVNFTYAIAKDGNGFRLNQYVDTMGTPSERRITTTNKIAGIGKSLYNDDFLEYLGSIVDSLEGTGINIVFSPNPRQARRTAVALSNRPGRPSIEDSRLSLLQAYLMETVAPEYALVDVVGNACAYHSGRVPTHVRTAIEDAARMGLIRDLVCTTTLMQGINLPAKVVVVRNPRLFLRKRKGYAPELSQYEFANLRGRAGRLLKDFVGRTIVLDESSFEHDEQEELFADRYKELSPGYGGAFQEREPEVLEALKDAQPSDIGEGKFLVTYVRQTMLRLGNRAEQRLREVGIVLSDGDRESAKRALRALTGKATEYTTHRLWDPFDLEALFNEGKRREAPRLPNSVWDMDLAKVLHDLILMHRNIAPYYVQRYLGESVSDGKAWAIALTAAKWAKERPLSEIIGEREFGEDASERIEDLIDLLMNKVVHGLTALLKPYSEKFSPESGVLAAIEMGVNRPVSRELLHLGLSRDTAVRVRGDIFADFSIEEVTADVIRSRLESRLGSLGFWTRREVEGVLGRR